MNLNCLHVYRNEKFRLVKLPKHHKLQQVNSMRECEISDMVINCNNMRTPELVWKSKSTTATVLRLSVIVYLLTPIPVGWTDPLKTELYQCRVMMTELRNSVK